MDEAGRSMKVDLEASKYRLRSANFVDVGEQVIRIPYGISPADPLEKEIGTWFGTGFVKGLTALPLAPLMRIKRRSVAEVYSLVHKVQQAIISQ
jgi:hypothetical protein